jgi:hypothetical protein
VFDVSIDNFNPVLWSKAFLFNLNKKHVHADVMNRDYEGEVKHGQSVKISSIGRITVKAYTRNAGAGGTAASPTIAGIDRPEILQGSSLFLTIDQQKYFNFEIDDIDRWQQVPDLMDKAMKEASYAMANTVDLFCNQTLQEGVATANQLTARTIGTGAGDEDAYELLVDLGVALEEQDVFGDKWIIVPPWFVGMLRKDDRFVGNGTSDNIETLKNGRIGRAAGFDIRQSNNICGTTAGTLAVSGGAYTILAGVKEAATYAEQVDKVVGFKPDDGFNDAMKGLHNYGAKVTRPYALASCAITKAS